MRYTERRADAGIEPSVGGRGDSYDKARAESVVWLFKTEVIQQMGRGDFPRPSSLRRYSGWIGLATVACLKRLASWLSVDGMTIAEAHLTNAVGSGSVAVSEFSGLDPAVPIADET
jgi:hypothetical protein